MMCNSVPQTVIFLALFSKKVQVAFLLRTLQLSIQQRIVKPCNRYTLQYYKLLMFFFFKFIYMLLFLIQEEARWQKLRMVLYSSCKKASIKVIWDTKHVQHSFIVVLLLLHGPRSHCRNNQMRQEKKCILFFIEVEERTDLCKLDKAEFSY